MLQAFRGGRYRYTPIPKYMFMVKFFRYPNDENTIAGTSSLTSTVPVLTGLNTVGPSEFGGSSFWGFIDPVKLSSLVSKVSIPKFSVDIESLDKIGPYGIKMPIGLTLDPISIEFNVDRKFTAERFYDLLLARMININPADGSRITGSKNPRSEYEIEIRVGIYEESSSIEIISYHYQQCVLVNAEGMEVDYESTDNMEPIKLDFFPNNGIEVSFDENKIRSLSGLETFGTSALKFVAYFGQVALDSATNLALREMSFQDAKFKTGDINKVDKVPR